MTPITKRDRHQARARRTHAKARVTGRSRLLVFRSNKAIYAQIVDVAGTVLCGTSSLKLKTTGIKAAAEVGKAIATLAKKSKVDQVSFDRNGYAYHGQVKQLAESAREAGLTF